ncbi:MAG TPA: RidA family protein [Candidatus Binatia bacterium]|jgi:enamine deaminase RidA (YjgF/YER057c/UK114 family)|nr:RidA family protein [Candidatus Binatia bacterium]
MPSIACPIVSRRFVGPEADELTIQILPAGSPHEVALQVEETYRALAAFLTAHGSSFQDVTAETLLLRDVRRDLPGILDVRARVLGDLGQAALAPRPAFIGQAPAGHDATFQLAATVVVPHRRDAWSVRDVAAMPSCPCDGCARSGARIVRLGDRTSVHTTNVYGEGQGAQEQALGMFHAAERLLDQCGMGFGDVVRTWIQLRDIDRDYGALNSARREFFESRGIGRRPASTGVQGTPFPDAHDVVMSLTAVRSSRPLDATVISTPTLNEAWSYGADFSRGLRLVEANQVTLHVSGTASIDEAGRTVHVGDFAAQAERMLHNISTLLAGQGATFSDLASAITYLKRAEDAAALQAIFQRRGFRGFPSAVVHAPLCRPELLCEAEAVSILPVKRSEA